MQQITITRITHACVLINFDGVYILTDPWFSQRRGYYRGEPLGMLLQDLPPLNAVVVSHGHYDHFDIDTFKAYRDHSVPLILKTGLAGKARAAGFTNITELEPWQTVTINDVTITATPAQHKVPENTYMFEWKNRTIFFGADSLLIPEFNDIAAKYSKIDVAFLPVNGLMIRPLFNRQVVMSAQQAAQACALLKPSFAIPIHYSFTGGFWRDRLLLKYNGTAQSFKDYARQIAPNTQVRILAPGQSLTI